MPTKMTMTRWLVPVVVMVALGTLVVADAAKRENVVSYLARREQATWRQRLGPAAG